MPRTKKSKTVEDKPPLEPPLRVNRNMVNKLLDSHDSENLREVGLLMSQRHDHVAARLVSSMTPEGHPAFPYRLETVARLAATLVKEGGFKQAAKDAVALLDACKAELSEITEKEAWRVLDEWTRWEAIPAPMSFAEAARYVTGKSTDNVAQPWFRRFLKHSIRVEKAFRVMREQATPAKDEDTRPQQDVHLLETTDEEVALWIDAHSNNIPGGLLHEWKEWFAAWQARENSEAKSRNGQLGGRPKNPPSEENPWGAPMGRKKRH